MIRCQNCGEEVEEGRGSCPRCGRPLTAAPTADEAGAGRTASTVALQTRVEREAAGGASAASSAPLSSFGQSKDVADGSRRVALTVMGIAAVVVVGAILLLLTPVGVKLGLRAPAPTGERRLEGAIRPGSPEFEQIRERLVVEFDPNENAGIGPTALGPWAVNMKPVVRNFTGRTVSGLEFHASGVDLSGRVIRERTFISEEEIEPNKVFTPNIGVNFPQDNKPANLKLELTGIRFK